MITTNTQTFENLKSAYNWANSLINQGMKTQPCLICEDRFVIPRGVNNRIFKLFGMTWKTEQIVRDIEPDGKWIVELDPPGTSYCRTGIFGPIEKQTQNARFSAWYNRFLPYAVAMAKSEHGFKASGIDFASINSYYGTCLGFCDLGLGYQTRIVQEDVELFSKIYDISNTLLPPSLPFDESWRSCVCYVAILRPDLLKFMKDSPVMQHAKDVADKLKWPT